MIAAPGLKAAGFPSDSGNCRLLSWCCRKSVYGSRADLITIKADCFVTQHALSYHGLFPVLLH
jgi:hypothetical protein